VSRHDPDRVYALGSRLLRSDARGEDWRIISPDLSKQIDRDTLPVMGRLWPDDAVWKHVFTNDYGVGVAFSESPFDEALLYVGTDDGLVQVTEDGGATWRRIDRFSGVPELIYVSDVVASRHVPDRVYALFNNHKRGDFKPYALRSDDRGRTWTSIAGDLPDRHVTWSLVEDPEEEDLLFLGTEFGLFVSTDRGGSWTELQGGAPTIPFRDLEIQEREGDLVAATFGRGFFVLDDLTALREIAAHGLETRAVVFPPRPAKLYTQNRFYTPGSGDANYAAPNPPFGATVTYYLPARVGDDSTNVVLVVKDAAGEIVNEVAAVNASGLQRTTWDLRYPAPVDDEGRRRGQGRLVEPGVFSVELESRSRGTSTRLTGPVPVSVEALRLR
jgi:hypothetical protein